MNLIQQLLAHPERYSVQEIQRGVQDGSIPAYVGIPMIKDKMQRQKQAQALAGGPQQQPPIAQQVMQEAQAQPGVAGLPSGMEDVGMAGGGIVAFAKGGDTPDTTDNRGWLDQLSDWSDRVTKQKQLDMEQANRARAEASQLEDLKRAARQSSDPYAQRIGQRLEAMSMAGAPASLANAQQMLSGVPTTASSYTAPPVNPSEIPTAPDLASQIVGAHFEDYLTSQLAQQGLGPDATATPPVPAAPPPAKKGIASLVTPAAIPANSELDKLRKGYEDIVAQTQNVKLPDRDFSKREARIAQDEEKAKQADKDVFNMALISAGARMMQTPGGFGVAAGAAIDSGMKAYLSGKKDVRDLEKDIADRRDRIEDLVAKGKEDQAHLEMQKLGQRVALHKETYSTAAHLQGVREQIAGHERVAGMQMKRYEALQDRAEKQAQDKMLHDQYIALNSEINNVEKNPATQVPPGYTQQTYLAALREQRDALSKDWQRQTGYTLSTATPGIQSAATAELKRRGLVP